jgi:glycosyltransferase involved in cell wall biosynthesis
MILFEAHVPPRNRFQAWTLKKVDGVVCNGYAVHRVLDEQGLLRPHRSIALHQGFNIAAYPSGDRATSRGAARGRLGWAETEKVAVYTGKVYWRYAEVELLLNAANQLAADEVRMVIVGGRADHAQLWRDEAARRGIHNVSFAGFVAPSDIVDYQVAADVLLSYYPSGIALNDYRSPGKLFEYMASGTPIAAGDYASLREVLDDGRNSLLVQPDRPELLAQAIRRLLDDPPYAAHLAAQARDDVTRFTWAARAASFFTFVEGLNSP